MYSTVRKIGLVGAVVSKHFSMNKIAIYVAKLISAKDLIDGKFHLQRMSHFLFHFLDV